MTKRNSADTETGRIIDDKLLSKLFCVFCKTIKRRKNSSSSRKKHYIIPIILEIQIQIASCEFIII